MTSSLQMHVMTVKRKISNENGLKMDYFTRQRIKKKQHIHVSLSQNKKKKIHNIHIVETWCQYQLLAGVAMQYLFIFSIAHMHTVQRV